MNMIIPVLAFLLLKREKNNKLVELLLTLSLVEKNNDTIAYCLNVSL